MKPPYAYFVMLLACIAGPPSALPVSIYDKYAGNWELNAAESDNLERAIEKTIASMTFLARPIARTKLRRRTVAFPRISIREEGENLRIEHTDGLNVLYPPDGSTIKARAPDGTAITTRMTLAPSLILGYEDEAGVREDQYSVSPDGRSLILSVRVTSRHLPRPLLYRLAYSKSH